MDPKTDPDSTNKESKVTMETLCKRIFGKHAAFAQKPKTWFVEIDGVKVTEEDFDALEPHIKIPPVVNQLADVKFPSLPTP